MWKWKEPHLLSKTEAEAVVHRCFNILRLSRFPLLFFSLTLFHFHSLLSQAKNLSLKSLPFSPRDSLPLFFSYLLSFFPVFFIYSIFILKLKNLFFLTMSDALFQFSSFNFKTSLNPSLSLSLPLSAVLFNFCGVRIPAKPIHSWFPFSWLLQV